MGKSKTGHGKIMDQGTVPRSAMSVESREEIELQYSIIMDDNSKKIKLLPFEELIKALDEKSIEYDKREIADAYFPLEDVEACMDDCRSDFVSLLSKRYFEDKANHRPCPLCGKPSEELKWICFSSPNRTWQNFCGRGGPMSICPDCGCLVEFVLLLMN